MGGGCVKCETEDIELCRALVYNLGSWPPATMQIPDTPFVLPELPSLLMLLGLTLLVDLICLPRSM